LYIRCDRRLLEKEQVYAKGVEEMHRRVAGEKEDIARRLTA